MTNTVPNDSSLLFIYNIDSRETIINNLYKQHHHHLEFP